MPASTFFGKNRKLDAPALERHDFKALDGKTELLVHRCKAGTKGPLIMAPGTAMSGLSYCIDTVDQNLVEYLAAEGYDMWLFDWRTSPELPSHKTQYTLDDVARHDWPAVVKLVRDATDSETVQVFAHCLGSTSFSMSLMRGYQPREQVQSFVASQVSLHLDLSKVGSLKTTLRLDYAIPDESLIHFEPDKVTATWGDFVIGFLSKIIPKTYSCDNTSCHRHSAMFGDLLWHPQINEATHRLVGALIPDCIFGFVGDVSDLVRSGSVIEERDKPHLDRMALPITFLSGEHNNMFAPSSTKATFEMLCDRNGDALYRRHLIKDYGHLDCIVGKRAAQDIYPVIRDALATD